MCDFKASVHYRHCDSSACITPTTVDRFNIDIYTGGARVIRVGILPDILQMPLLGGKRVCER